MLEELPTTLTSLDISWCPNIDQGEFLTREEKGKRRREERPEEGDLASGRRDQIFASRNFSEGETVEKKEREER
jgi:hypothetical protein